MVFDCMQMQTSRCSTDSMEVKTQGQVSSDAAASLLSLMGSSESAPAFAVPMPALPVIPALGGSPPALPGPLPAPAPGAPTPVQPLSPCEKAKEYSFKAKKQGQDARWLSISLKGLDEFKDTVHSLAQHALRCESLYHHLAQLIQNGSSNEEDYARTHSPRVALCMCMRQTIVNMRAIVFQ